MRAYLGSVAIPEPFAPGLSNGHASVRGHFKPWALLRMPEIGRAFRFVYPALLVATRNSAYVWDIPTGTMIQTIRDTGLGGHICYVELGARHVFICGPEVLRVFSREDGRNVLNISSTREVYADWVFSLKSYREPEGNETPGGLVASNIQRRGGVEHPSRRRRDQFIAGGVDAAFSHGSIHLLSTMHVSSCGSHLVALLRRSRLLILYDFEQVIRKEVELEEAIVDVQLGQPRYPSVYLAFEYNRVAVATVRSHAASILTTK